MVGVKLTAPQPCLSTLPTKALVSPRRVDIAVKYRFFRHLLCGGDPDSERVFLWHIEKRSGHRMRVGAVTDGWKRSLQDYTISARHLFRDMQDYGFRPDYAVPIDADGELFGGAHRLACALALGVADVPVEQRGGRCWAPAWGAAWFVDNGIDADDLARIVSDWQALNDSNPR